MREPRSSFSLVLETANLGLADLAGLRKSLDSIAAQSLNVSMAREVVMVEGGEAPVAMLNELRRDYPWLSFHAIPRGTGYEEAKLIGIQKTTGDILVFFDADCVYSKDWLKGLVVDGLDAHAELGVLGGETMIRTDSVWGVISALLFSFNFYSKSTKIYEHKRFHFNNFAIRRHIIKMHPLPTKQPLFRTSTLLYAADLRRSGIRVARQPASRAVHAAPHGWSHFFWRYLLFGHDAATVTQLIRVQQSAEGPSNAAEGSEILRRASLKNLIVERLTTITGRIAYLLRQDPVNPLRVLLALPLVGVGLILMLFGYTAYRISPHLLPQLIPAEVKAGTGLAEQG